MSFSKVTKRQYLKCKGGRLGSQFLKRLDRGLLIDRNQTKRPKEVKTVEAPSALTKFARTTEEYGTRHSN